MANTLTNLTVDLYNALDVVSRELTGFIPAVSNDMTFERAAVGQTVRSPVAPAATAGDITPAVTAPDDGNQTIGNVDMSITKARRVPVRWNGEEILKQDNNGAQYNVILRDQFAQAMRTLCNEVEVDLGALYTKASRAYGTAGTTPFATAGNFTDASYLAKLLKDNGAPPTGNQLILNTAAGANLIGYQSRVDVAGQEAMLRQGVLLDTAGFAIRESAQVVTTTAGTASGAKTDNAGYAIGAVTLTLGSDGTGTIVAGDCITLAGDTNIYSVVSGDADVSGGGTITLAAPGLKVAITTAQVAITMVAASARNMGFTKNAIALATRAPALPAQGDAASDRMFITDDRSGLSFEVALYKQYRQIQYEISLAWGVAMVKPEHCVMLLG